MSTWQNEAQAKAFLQGIRGAIPGAELQFEIISTIVRQWLADSTEPASILDLGCGDGILGRYLLQQLPQAKAVFIDHSDPMLQAARQHLKETPNACVIAGDFSSPEWTGQVTSHAPFSIIVSGYAIHHQPDSRKRAIYSEIYDLLAPGGIFLNVEHVASSTPDVESLFDELFIDHLYGYQSSSQEKTDVSREKIAREYHSRPDKKENILAPVEQQCEWLRESGFRDVDCFFKALELAIFGGRK